MSCESAVFAWLEATVTMLILTTTCWGVKAASALWENKRAENTEAMTAEILMVVVLSSRRASTLGQEPAEDSSMKD